MEEQWARVIDHDLANNVIVAVSESKLLLCRLKPKAGIDQLLVTARVYIGEDSSKRAHIAQVLGMTNLGRLANHIRADLPLVVQIFIEENEKHFIAAFFNVAGNMSLKQHAFELLQGVGNKKAMQMVEARGSTGFESLTALNEACNIDAGELLAKRFFSELEDRNIQPRLLDLLLPVKA
jgi:predicted nucleic acid-binding OB-fold protein